MILINQTLDETLRHTRDINALKALIFQTFGRPEHLSAFQTVFGALVDSPGRATLDKRDLNRAVGLSPETRQFADHFFFLNATNENHMTLGDFNAYLRRHLPVPGGPSPQPTSLQSLVSQLLNKELIFFNSVAPRKAALRASFQNENGYFDFLQRLFGELSTYNGRTKSQSLDFQKFNVDLRQKHGFSLFSMAEFALLQSHFDLNCDAAVSQEEFLYALADYPAFQRLLQLRLHEQVRRVGSEPFLPLNRSDVNVQYNLNNFVVGDLQAGGPQNLKSLIMKSSAAPRFESDAFVVGGHKVFRQPDYGQLVRTQNYPQVITPVDPNEPSETDRQVAGEPPEFAPAVDLSESRRVFLKDVKMTQLTVDEELRRQDVIANLDEVQSREFTTAKKPVPARQSLDESAEANLSQLDSVVRTNLDGFRY